MRQEFYPRSSARWRISPYRWTNRHAAFRRVPDDDANLPRHLLSEFLNRSIASRCKAFAEQEVFGRIAAQDEFRADDQIRSLPSRLFDRRPHEQRIAAKIPNDRIELSQSNFQSSHERS